ncbi:complement C3-like isoform X2 [Dreissena polymorpha]|uniref:complement C3-like isoform X2 n=1 Tax=Dreissena polymorpha TaxID=45954 RepID=UPI002264B328|nr:complement C3-like isoform X2 [Dreissena polymorpha]
MQEERPHLKCVEFSVRTKSPSYEAGMSIVEVNLETGVSVVESDLKSLQSNNTVFSLYEMPTDGKGFIIFYLSKITSRPIKFIFRLKDDFSGNETTRQGASVRVYDYYNPEKSCMKQYSINPNKANTVAMACEGGEQCKCVQSQCSQPVDDELFRMASAVAKEQNAAKKRTLPKPVEKLMEYACNFEKANYVVYVTIVTVANDTQRNVRFASSTVKEVLLQGGGNIRVGDAFDFEWQTDCAHPAFEVGQPYYVIGKDISRLINGDAQSERYDLMGTTLVINPSRT